MSQTDKRPTVQMVNLGCAKNTVDAEEMLGVLTREGYGVDAQSRQADVVIINTCGFIESAKQESIDAILAAVRRKQRGSVRKVVVAGCLAQRYAKELAEELPEVDAFIGVGQMSEIGAVVGDTLIRPDQLLRVRPKSHHRWLDDPARVVSTAPWTAYLKISEGCNHRCSFCAIPAIRGRHVSKPLERIVQEAQQLADSGVLELNLIAQDTTQYGRDLYHQPMLPKLLRELSHIDALRWIRLFYCYPSNVNQAVIEAITQTPKVQQYIDMPLQHADGEVLRAMRRPGDAGSYLRLIERFRQASPDIAIRTTFIVGFPGETAKQYDNLLRFVEQAQFDRAGVFEYSNEDGTSSAALDGQVSSRVKRARHHRLMELQQAISLERNRRWIGRDIEVLVEDRNVVGSSKQRSVITDANAAIAATSCVGRSFRDGLEIDGQVYIAGSCAQPGEFINVRVTDAQPYDLIGE